MEKGIIMYQTGLEQKPQAENSQTSPPAAPVSPPNPNNVEWNRGVHSAIALCSLALIGCFFLPWIKILLGAASGYDLQQLPGAEVKFVWLIPVFAFLSLLAAVMRQSATAAASFAGIVPFLLLLFYGTQLGKEFLETLQVGAYLSLALGALLLILPQLLKNPQS